MTDLTGIAQAGRLVVAIMGQDIPPMVVYEDDGTLKGFDIALARTMANELGVEIEFDRSANTFDAVVARVAAGKADLGLSFLSRTPARARYVLLSRPYVRQNWVLLMNRLRGLDYNGRCPSMDDILVLAGQTDGLGVLKGSALTNWLTVRVPEARLRLFDGGVDRADALLANQFVASFEGELSARLYLDETPQASIRLKLCEVPKPPDGIAVAVRPGAFGLLNWVNVFLDDRGVDYDVETLIDHEGPWVF